MDRGMWQVKTDLRTKIYFCSLYMGYMTLSSLRMSFGENVCVHGLMKTFLPIERTSYTDTKQFGITWREALTEYKELCKKILNRFPSAVYVSNHFSTQFIEYIINTFIDRISVWKRCGDPVVTFPECVVLTKLDHIAYYHTVKKYLLRQATVFGSFRELYYFLY